jgi:hypothetical protein
VATNGHELIVDFNQDLEPIYLRKSDVINPGDGMGITHPMNEVFAFRFRQRSRCFWLKIKLTAHEAVAMIASALTTDRQLIHICYDGAVLRPSVDSIPSKSL